jgi:ABC-type glutathione transport system ATPase component
MIAMALACRPKLLIADEPTTALDVTIQAQMLDLLLKLRCENGRGLVLITHDMGVVAETADRVIVQYAGQQVEANETRELFADPHHPYTAACSPPCRSGRASAGCRRSRASCRGSSIGRGAVCSAPVAASSSKHAIDWCLAPPRPNSAAPAA